MRARRTATLRATRNTAGAETRRRGPQSLSSPHSFVASNRASHPPQPPPRSLWRLRAGRHPPSGPAASETRPAVYSRPQAATPGLRDSSETHGSHRYRWLGVRQALQGETGRQTDTRRSSAESSSGQSRRGKCSVKPEGRGFRAGAISMRRAREEQAEPCYREVLSGPSNTAGLGSLQLVLHPPCRWGKRSVDPKTLVAATSTLFRGH
ncbi:hypothetical protein NN561_010648 [Cricetulus griseus]